MPQSGFTPVQTYSSSTPGNVPLAANLTNTTQGAELAINIADGKLFYKDSSGVVQVIASKGGAGSSTTTQVLYNSSGLVVGSANMVFNGTTITSAFSGPHNGTVGATTANTGAFTTLSASSTVSGAGFSNYFAAPPTIGSTTPNAGTFTALVATSITDSGLTAGRVNYNGAGGLLTDSANMVFDGSTLTTLNTAYTGTLTGGTGVVNLGSGQFYKDASGNVGIGVTPSAWSQGKALEVGGLGNAIWGNGVADIYTTSNVYYQSGWKYASTNGVGVGIYEINGAAHYWYGAPSGTTGGAVTLTGILQVRQGYTLALQGSTPTTGTGVAFPATQNASSDANTLDDYEEGTWTPTIASTGGTITSYTTGTCNYTKIGRQVIATFNVTITNNGTGNGFINISLPFTSLIGNTSVGAGREDFVSGDILQIYVNQSTNVANTFFYNNTYPGGTNYRLVGTISFLTP